MIGKVIKQRYRIYDEIGQGSVAAVYLANLRRALSGRPKPSPKWMGFCVALFRPSLLSLLFRGNRLDAVVDLSTAQRAQDDLGRLLAQDAMQLDRGQRGVPIGQEKAEN